MVPKPNAESHKQPARHLLSRCDAIADSDHYRSGRPIRELFDEERGEMQPLPRARFDAVEWVERKADKEGNARSVISRARHGAAGRCSRACARSRWGSAPPTAGT